MVEQTHKERNNQASTCVKANLTGGTFQIGYEEYENGYECQNGGNDTP